MSYATYPNRGLDGVKVGDLLVVTPLDGGSRHKRDVWTTKVVKIGRTLVHCEAQYGRDETVAFRKENGSENRGDRAGMGSYAQTGSQVAADIEREPLVARLYEATSRGWRGWRGGDLTNDQIARVLDIIETPASAARAARS